MEDFLLFTHAKVLRYGLKIRNFQDEVRLIEVLLMDWNRGTMVMLKKNQIT